MRRGHGQGGDPGDGECQRKVSDSGMPHENAWLAVPNCRQGGHGLRQILHLRGQPGKESLSRVGDAQLLRGVPSATQVAEELELRGLWGPRHLVAADSEKRRCYGSATQT